ncbi:MAG: EFR1 family ferrodoxin [Deltaproteobacteria bacterium]|nr:MAG: EFR1 family ferrodoxin [Deltaproteobacteria bacterium]
MAGNGKRVFTVYFSPAGSTRHVAQVMGKRFKGLGCESSIFDLAENREASTIISEQIRGLKGNSCLIVGSPVYVSHAAPPIMQFISKLIGGSSAYAVPFVTWGGASSGISLFEMSRELSKQGFTILGAAKVLAVHSLMWQLDHPLGEGHPSSEDDRMVRELVDEIYARMHSESPKGIELSELDYQSKKVHAEMEKVSLEVAKAHMPTREVAEALCDLCKICAEVCPVGAVALSPYPVFEETCIYCFNCVRNCPEGAINADMTGIWQRIRERAETFVERPYTKIFI